MSLYSLLVNASESNGSSPFVETEQELFSFTELLERCDRVAANLTTAGAEKNDFIIVSDDNRLSVLIYVFAVRAINATPVIIAPDIFLKKRSYFLEKVKPKVVVTNDEITGFLSSVKSGDSEIVVYTSGTISDPKGVMFSYRNLIENSKSILSYINLDNTSQALITKSLHHIGPYTCQIIPALLTGTSIFLTSKTSIIDYINIISSRKITYLDTVGTMLRYMLKFSNKFSKDNINLKIISINGENFAHDDIKKLKNLFPGASIFYSYGLTEAGPRVSYLPEKYIETKVGSVGVAIENVSIKINPQFDHNEYSAGEILVKSPSLMQGYLHNEELTQATIKEGWIHTGDLGYIDADGFLYVLGRKDHMICRGGNNIFPNEIEDVLRKKEGVQDCVIVSKEDYLNGRKIIAKVVLEVTSTLSKSDLFHYLREKLPPIMIPEEITFVTELPVNSGGKVVKHI